MNNNYEKEFIEPCNAACSFCFLNYVDVLEDNYLFKNLSHTEIGNIIKEVHHQVKSFTKGEVVASAGEEYKNLYIIVKGSVVGEIIDFEGRVLRIEELNAPDTIATAFIFGENNALPVDITAVKDTKVLVFSKNELVKLFKRNEMVLQNYLDIMANKMQHLSRKIKLLGLHTIRGKIAHYLLELVKKCNCDTVKMPNTQEELALMFGVARPSIARTLKELNEEGIIEGKGKNISIINKAALSALLR